MKRSLNAATGLGLALILGQPARAAEFGETNVERGCIILSLNVSTRVDGMFVGEDVVTDDLHSDEVQFNAF